MSRIDRIRTVTGTIDCPNCGEQSWNAALNRGEPCLRCKRAMTAERLAAIEARHPRPAMREPTEEEAT